MHVVVYPPWRRRAICQVGRVRCSAADDRCLVCVDATPLLVGGPVANAVELANSRRTYELKFDLVDFFTLSAFHCEVLRQFREGIFLA